MAYVGNQAQTAFTSFDKQTITGDGTAVYTLSHSVANDQEVEVFVNNVRQEGGSGKAYTVSGNQITFSENIASTDDCYVVFQGKAVQTVVPPAGSVTDSMITDMSSSKLTGALPVLDGSALTGVSAGARNLITNSGFQVAQRGTSFTGITSTIAYRMDRWQVGFGAAGSNYSITQATDAPDNFKYSMKWQRTASNAVTNSIWFSQAFESINSKVVAGKTCTLSYFAKKGANYSATSSDIQVRIISGTGTDESATSAITAGWAGYATPLSTTQVITSSWVRYTHSVTFASNINQISVNLASNSAGTAGADDSLYITGVQLEVGSATLFEHPRSFGDELLRCQRFYVQQRVDIQTPAAGYMIVPIYFPTTMRSAPTVSAVSAGSAIIASQGVAGLHTQGAYFQVQSSANSNYVLGRIDAYAAEL